MEYLLQKWVGRLGLAWEKLLRNTMKKLALAMLTAMVLGSCGAQVCVFGNFGECPAAPSGSPSQSSGGKLALNAPSTTIRWNEQLIFTASGGNPPYRYVVKPAGAGTINADGTYRAPARGFSGVPVSVSIEVTDTQFRFDVETVNNRDHFAVKTITVSD